MGDRFDDVTVRTAYRTGWTRRFWGCGRGLRAGCGVVALVGGEDELVALVCRDCWLRWSVGTAGRAGSSRDEGGCWLPWREILRWRRGELVALAGGVGGCVRAEVSWWRWSVGTAGCVGGKRCAGSSRDAGGCGRWRGWLRWLEQGRRRVGRWRETVRWRRGEWLRAGWARRPRRCVRVGALVGTLRAGWPRVGAQRYRIREKCDVFGGGSGVNAMKDGSFGGGSGRCGYRDLEGFAVRVGDFYPCRCFVKRA